MSTTAAHLVDQDGPATATHRFVAIAARLPRQLANRTRIATNNPQLKRSASCVEPLAGHMSVTP